MTSHTASARTVQPPQRAHASRGRLEPEVRRQSTAPWSLACAGIREKDTTTIRSAGQCRSDLLDMSSVVATTACDVLPEAQPLVASPERAAKALEILG